MTPVDIGWLSEGGLVAERIRGGDRVSVFNTGSVLEDVSCS